TSPWSPPLSLHDALPISPPPMATTLPSLRHGSRPGWRSELRFWLAVGWRGCTGSSTSASNSEALPVLEPVPSRGAGGAGGAPDRRTPSVFPAPGRVRSSGDTIVFDLITVL